MKDLCYISQKVACTLYAAKISWVIITCESEFMNQDILSHGAFSDYYCLRKIWSMIPFRYPLWSVFQVSDWVYFSSSWVVMTECIVCSKPSPHQDSYLLAVYWEFRMQDLRANYRWKLIYFLTSERHEQLIILVNIYSSQIYYLKILGYYD